MIALYRVMFGLSGRRYTIAVEAESASESIEIALDRLSVLGEDRETLSLLAYNKNPAIAAKVIRVDDR